MPGPNCSAIATYSRFGALVPNRIATRTPARNASAMARATRPAPSEPRTAAAPEQDQRLGAQEHAPAHRPEQPLPEEQRRADRDEERHEDERPDRDPGGDGDGLDLAADLGRLGAGEVDVGPDEADDRVTGRAQLAAQARRRVAAGCRLRPRGSAGRVVRARRVRIRLERSASRAGFGRGTRVVGSGPIGIQRTSSGSGVGSRRGTAAIIPAPTPASGCPSAPRPRRRLTVTRRLGVGEPSDPAD